MGKAGALIEAWRWRRRRQVRLARAWRKRRELVSLADRTETIRQGDVLAFLVLRNEAHRLPNLLAHYRALGVAHFLVVDNDSTDGSRDLLADQADVSLWHTQASYRAARFGVDWVQSLLMRHGNGHWCLTVDADELLVYPHHDTRPLPALTAWLDAEGERSLGALMLDLFPQGPLDTATFRPGQDPVDALPWYDSANYTIQQKPDTGALWIQGGPRSRAFFAEDPQKGPTLTKVPLVKWSWRYAYVNSTHTLLPRALNRIYDTGGGEKLSGVLLHTKFLPGIGARSAEEKTRRQHFGAPGDFDAYYDALTAAPDLWHPHASRYRGWRQLEAEGLMSRGGWG
ncbi:MAG: glycosyltransferase family 2 protein [Rhodobacter sp.]|nr:glycosyltransferase family 2 protein [Paracoccaceae bacterium]MCC0081172.1 glycosyltransferase family 2 protein [Rhodobacter sp.]